MLSVVVHTEEEFDWNDGYNRNAVGVTHMREIGRFQSVCDAAAIVPTYVVDYPIASQPEGFEPLRRFAAAGRALIGAHLHPWVSPPYEEPVTRRNSFPGNLPRQMEYEKLSRLTDQISVTFGGRPTVYLAGRYGIGANTPEILEALGYEVDLSRCVPMDFSTEDGPDFSPFTSDPYWFGGGRRLLGLPCTGGFVGWLPAGKRLAHRVATDPRVGRLRLSGVLARLRAVERLGLTPEVFVNAELRRLTKRLLRKGLRVFVFYLHSPSVSAGRTPYTRDDEDVRKLLANCAAFFRFFKDDLNGASMTPIEIKAAIEQGERQRGLIAYNRNMTRGESA
jgi:hypothetical protein